MAVGPIGLKLSRIQTYKSRYLLKLIALSSPDAIAARYRSKSTVSSGISQQ